MQHSSSIFLRGFTALVFLFLMAACSKKNEPVVRENIVLTQSLDLFQQPVIPPALQRSTGDTIVAIVNGESISAAELEREANALALQLRSRMTPERIEQEKEKLIKQALDTLIGRRLLLAGVDSEKIALEPEAVDQALDQLLNSLPDEVTLETFMERAGVTEETLRENITSELQVQALLQEHVPVPPLADDIQTREFYTKNQAQFVLPERLRVEHILIEARPDSDESSRQNLAQALRDSWTPGQSLSNLIENVEAAQDLTCNEMIFARGRAPVAIEKQLFDLEPGEMSPILPSQAGLHLFRVIEEIPSQTLPFEEVREQIQINIQKMALQQNVNDYIKELRESADVVIKF